MSKLVISSIVGLGGVIGVGGGAYLLNKNSSSPTTKETIRSRLNNEGFAILNINGDHDYWRAVKEEYNKFKGEISKAFKIHNSVIDENKLKDLCKEVWNKSEDDSSYEKTKRWCVIPISLSAHLDKQGFQSFSSQDNDQNPDKGKWEKVVIEYKKEESRKVGIEESLSWVT